MAEKNILASLRLVGVLPAQLEGVLAESTGKVLGVLAYAPAKPSLPVGSLPFAWVQLPVFGNEAWCEALISPHSVVVSQDSGIHFSCDGSLLFGSLILGDENSGHLESKTFAAYSAIFDMLDREGYPEMLRVWNYIPHINDTGREIERYREFNVGRHEAFCSKGRTIDEGIVPASCALGIQQSNLVVCFLAGKTPGAYIENPRQTNACRYPSEFGPKSPTFSRGVLVGDALFVSGTASIIGSGTVHHGDVLRQLDETIENLQVVVDQARTRGFAARNPRGLCLNVYLRNARDYPVVRDWLDAKFSDAQIVYLQADVCRADLLVEIEAFWMSIP
jgi:enamine deaminase RidA (YjgF/YER057c/UK114 family)